MNRRTGTMTAALLLAGCVAGPNYRAPKVGQLGVPASYAAPVTGTAVNEPGSAEADLSNWWRRLGDPMLTELVARATAGNLQIAQSAARLLQAREARVQARSDVLPSLTGSTGVTRNFSRGGASSIVLGSGSGSGSDGTGSTVVTTGNSSAETQLSLGLDARWQVDLFGGLTRTLQATRADEAVAHFDLEAVRTSIAGEVATNYVDARQD